MSLYHVNRYIYSRRGVCVHMYAPTASLSCSLALPRFWHLFARAFSIIDTGVGRMNAGGEKMQSEEANDASEIGFKFSNCVFLSPAYFAQFLCLAQQTRRHRKARGVRHGLAQCTNKNCLLQRSGADKRRTEPRFQ